MFRMNAYLAAPAFALLMSGTAHAALTADQVWQSWKDAGAMVGLTISAATENNSGGVLTLNGVSIAPEGMAGLTICYSSFIASDRNHGAMHLLCVCRCLIRRAAIVLMECSMMAHG